MTTSPASSNRFQISVHRSRRKPDVSVRELKHVVMTVLRDEGVTGCDLSIAIVDDPTIHEVNREHLQHDYPTDVISFLFDATPDEGVEVPQKAPKRRGRGLVLEGEVVVSADTAIREAVKHNWSGEDELRLYLIHGLLHLCGYDDLSPPEKRIMRRRERECLALLQTETPRK